MCGRVDLYGFVKVAVLYILYLLFKMNIFKSIWGGFDMDFPIDKVVLNQLFLTFSSYKWPKA